MACYPGTGRAFGVGGFRRQVICAPRCQLSYGMTFGGRGSQSRRESYFGERVEADLRVFESVEDFRKSVEAPSQVSLFGKTFKIFSSQKLSLIGSNSGRIDRQTMRRASLHPSHRLNHRSHRCQLPYGGIRW